jgi:hypothetical protein
MGKFLLLLDGMVSTGRVPCVKLLFITTCSTINFSVPTFIVAPAFMAFNFSTAYSFAATVLACSRFAFPAGAIAVFVEPLGGRQFYCYNLLAKYIMDQIAILKEDY